MNRVIAIIVTFFSLPSGASNHELIYQGIYSWGHEVHTFRPCNGKTEFWVSFNWAGFEMHRYYRQSISRPYQPMYVEFRGQVLNETVDGFAKQYDGLIRISEVKKYSFEIPVQCN
jgi:hypothetical protein